MALDSNLPATAGTADDEPLSLEDGTGLLSELEERSKPDTGADSDEDAPPADKSDDDTPKGPEQDEQPPEDDTPEWDKTDSEPDKKDGQDDGKTPAFASENTKFKLSDGSEITVGELARNNLYQADYTKKTQALAQTERTFVERFAQVQQYEHQLTQQTELTLSLLAQVIPPEPDAQLRASDPLGYMEARAQRDDAVRALTMLNEQLQGNRSQLTAQQQANQTQASQRRQQEEMDRLITAMPQLRDAKKREAFTTDIVTGLKGYGFEPRELSDLVDHRWVLVAADAARYRRVMANKGQAKQKAPTTKAPVTRSGGALRPAMAEIDENKAFERLNKTGSLDDAVELAMARSRRKK